MKTWQLLKKNPHLFERYFVKEYTIKAARKFFEDKNYHELESPILSDALPSERYLDAFETKLELANGINKKLFMIPSTETFNKRILAAGLGNHFVISKVFRGLEHVGPNHTPEFTMLEWYDLGYDYNQLMLDCENLIRSIKHFIDKKQNREPSDVIVYNKQEINIAPNWPKISVDEGLRKYANISLSEIADLKSINKVAKSKGYNTSGEDDWETIFELIFLNEVETNFPKDRPIFVYNYPKQLCPLTKSDPINPLVCQKVELYIAGKEIANGYTELLDHEEQKRRFIEEFEARKKMGKKEITFDNDLIDALKSGVPDVAGMGMGIDRLAMILANAQNINEINYFPVAEMFDADE